MERVSAARTVVGLLVNQMEGRYQALLRRGLSDLCRERGVALRLFVGRSLASPYGTEDDENHVYALARPGRRDEQLDGLVVSAGSIGSFVSPERLVRFLEGFRPLPLVTIGFAAPGFPAIACDNDRGITEMVTHLVRSHGHRRVAYLGGPVHAPDAVARLAAFSTALRAVGLDPDDRLVFRGDFSHRSGERMAASLEVSGHLPFDAVVAANDEMALGFVAGLERRGFVCPRDYAITGFDDLPDARIAAPALTTVHQPLYQEGRAAGERLLRFLEKGDWGMAPLVEALPATPVVRRSCGCSEEPCIARRAHRATDPARAAGSLREVVLSASAELSLSVRNRDQAVDVLSALAETIVLDLRTFRDHPLFLQALSEWFDLTIGWEDFSADWHSLLTLFHREALKTVLDARSREHVDDLMQAGFALLARKAGERDARELAALRSVMGVFRDLSGRLSTVTDVEGLSRALRELGPLAGLTRLELHLLRTGPVPLGPDELDPLQGELDRTVCIAAGSGDEQTILPLVSRRYAHGYLLVESVRHDGMVFDLVRDQISQALGSILLSNERSRAEDALRRSEERFRELASAVPMMVLETDLALNVTYVNPAAREGLGLAAEPDGSLRTHLPAEDEALAADLVRRIGQVRTLSYPGVRLVNPVARRYVPVIQISGVFDRAGQLTGSRWSALDPLPLLAGGMLPDAEFYAERKITGREQEVVELLLQGFRIRDMADRLSIAESTVKGHLTQVYNKLGISGRDELLRLFQEEQVRRRGFNAFVFGLVARLLNVGGDAEPAAPRC
jgi:DNA-binding LacI/PurR family transcriptional regulator/DNA-binding CsgD family transcriptional regulator/PAS domain-containing protein